MSVYSNAVEFIGFLCHHGGNLSAVVSSDSYIGVSFGIVAAHLGWVGILIFVSNVSTIYSIIWSGMPTEALVIGPLGLSWRLSCVVGLMGD